MLQDVPTLMSLGSHKLLEGTTLSSSGLSGVIILAGGQLGRESGGLELWAKRDAGLMALV